MSYVQGNFKLTNTKKLNRSCFDFSVFCPEIAKSAKPGQFIHIRCEGKTLRRPISICEIGRKSGNIRFVFDIRGEGTQWLSLRAVGESLDILGPLGNGFDLSDRSKRALFVGGGMGVPPLLAASKEYNGTADAVLGFKCSDNAILAEEFMKVCKNVHIMCDDGSVGSKGLATDALVECLKASTYDIVYSCGPAAMMKAVSDISNEKGIPCFVSLEERMGCGVGACLVCACKIKTGDLEVFKHVCKDGPVFDSKEVVGSG